MSISRCKQSILFALAVFSGSLLVFFLYRRPYVWEWDGFGFASSTVLHCRHSLVTGRIGTILYFIPLWEFHRLVFQLPARHVWVATSQACMVASALSVVCAYFLARQLISHRVAWMTAILLSGSYAWVSYASATTAEMVMIAAGLAGITVFWAGVTSERLGVMAVGSALVGYSILSKEQGLAYGPFLVVALSVHFSRLRTRFGWCLILLPVVCLGVGVSGPVWFWVTDGAKYLEGFRNPGTVPKVGWNAFVWRWDFLWRTWSRLCGAVPLALAFGGTGALVWRKNWQVLALIWSLILPAGIHLFVGFLGERYYLFVVPPLMVLAAVAIDKLAIRSVQRRSHWIVSLFAVLLVSLTSLRFHIHPRMEEMNRLLSDRKNFAALLLERMPEQGKFLLGPNDIIIDFLRLVGERPGWSPLTFCWDIPENRIEIIDEALANGERVFIQPAALQSNQQDKRDRQEIERRYSLSPVIPRMIFEILPLSQTLRDGNRSAMR